ncbi:hypothetical protein FW755_11660 [Lonepinella koalarum]|uniref:P22AR C-terminal domain-containing protein n=1 Tax=Lonepinella koalarum TaxID=53417 RepID=UPI0011E3F408|nr:Bro-N domain-containing protein [Lonepinella koalarum]TYG33573.1 hypothetical protein FW755_11660 [Lonepinella koalarum]
MSNQTQLSIFNFETNSVRVIAINNEPWFVACDICNVLDISNVSDALLKLDDDEKTTIGLTDSQAGKGAQSISLVSESGMYTLILRCRNAVKKGSAPHRFRKWVTNEILPQIRKTGQYAVQAEQLALPEPEPLISKSLTESEWLQFAGHWFALYNALDLLAELEQPLQAIGSRFAVTAYTHAREYANNLGLMKRILEPMLAEFDVDPIDEPYKFNALKTLREFKVKGLANAVRLSNQPRAIKN